MKRKEYAVARRRALLDGAIEKVKATVRDLEEADAWVDDTTSQQVQERLFNVIELIKALGGEDHQ